MLERARFTEERLSLSRTPPARRQHVNLSTTQWRSAAIVSGATRGSSTPYARGVAPTYLRVAVSKGERAGLVLGGGERESEGEGGLCHTADGGSPH